jgi:hypothetical protein
VSDEIPEFMARKPLAVPTKMVRRPTPNFVDSLIGSIGALYVTIISFVLIYSYVGINLYQHNQTFPKLVAVDKLLALRHLTVGNHVLIRDAKLSDLPRFFSDAQSESFNEFIQGNENEDNSTEKQSEQSPSKFTAEPLQQSQIFREVPMRMAVGGTCNVLVTKLSPGQEYHFITALIVGEVYKVKSEDVRLATFFRCESGPNAQLQVMIFKLDEGQFAFGLPRSLEEQFFSSPLGFSNYPLGELRQTLKLLPSPMEKYVQFSEEYVVLHAKAIDYFILSYANAQLGKYFTADRLDDATQQLYEQKERDASYFGISAPNTFLIEIGPLIYFALSFELWRRVRRLPTGKLVSDKYWFAFETRDVVGRSYSVLFALAPLLFGVLIYVLFAISQGLGLVVFGRVFTIPGLLTLNFPMAPGPGWMTTNYFAFAIAFALVPAHFLILLLTVRKLVSVVAANIRQT